MPVGRASKLCLYATDDMNSLWRSTPGACCVEKSGAVYEKSLIESYIAENGKDPITNDELTVDDLVELRPFNTVKPRPPQFTSIPSLLSAFQNEWDALALERFRLQQELEQARRELSTALYENDAAVKVLARIQKERDEARDALSKLSINGQTTEADSMQVDGQALSEELATAVSETHAVLSKTRRKRPVPEDWAAPDEVASFKVQKISDSANPVSKFLSIDDGSNRLLHAAGQASGSAAVFSLEQKDNIENFTSHQDGEISGGIFTNDNSIAVGTTTGAIGVLDRTDGSLDISRIPHSGEVTSVSMHPSGKFFASTSLDKSYIFFRIDDAEPAGGIQVAAQVTTDTPLSTGSFHPDGHLFAAGGHNGEIKIYETSTGNKAATFEIGGPVQSLAFSENGTWLAASVKGDAEVQVWDLRKTAVIQRLSSKGPVHCVRWDYTGQFLVAAGSMGTTIFGYTKASKEWSELVQSPAEAVAVLWGKTQRPYMA